MNTDIAFIITRNYIAVRDIFSYNVEGDLCIIVDKRGNYVSIIHEFLSIYFHSISSDIQSFGIEIFNRGNVYKFKCDHLNELVKQIFNAAKEINYDEMRYYYDLFDKYTEKVLGEFALFVDTIEGYIPQTVTKSAAK